MVEIDERRLKRMVALGLSVDELAVLWGCSPATIRKRLKVPIKARKTDAGTLNDDGIRALCAAIVKQAVHDLRKRKVKHDRFFGTEWCDNLLYGAGINLTGKEVEREVANGKSDAGKHKGIQSDKAASGPGAGGEQSECKGAR